MAGGVWHFIAKKESKIFVLAFFFRIYYLFLCLRYRLIIKGAETLKQNKGPLLILPNHPALVDPQILFTKIFLICKKIPVPMVLSKYYDLPLLKIFFQKINAVRIKQIDSFNEEDLPAEKFSLIINKSIETSVSRLKNGHIVLLYPSGKTYSQGFEVISGKKSTYQIIKEIDFPITIIGVRTRGLWGSVWSRAWDGNVPDVFFTGIKCIGYLIANFLFFLPKREVKVEFVDITDECLNKVQKEEVVVSDFNHYLEKFFNQKGVENPHYLKHFFFLSAIKKEIPDKIYESLEEGDGFFEKRCKVNFVSSLIEYSKLNYLKKVIAKIKNVDIDKVEMSSHLIRDLSCDSLDIVDIYIELKNKFSDIQEVSFLEIKFVGDFYNLIKDKSLSKDLESDKNLDSGININSDINLNKDKNLNEENLYIEDDKKKLARVQFDPQKNIVQNFLINIATTTTTTTKRSSREDYFLYDSLLGNTTKKQFLFRCILISQFIKKNISYKYVAIMLPALQISPLLIMATYLAGKVPVMLNWTIGQKNLYNSVNLLNIHKIITSKNFFEKIKDQIPDNLEEKLIFVEKIKKEINFIDKTKSIFCYLFNKKVFFNRKYYDEAVILFTSGSESLPKIVPLTHSNILYDIYGTEKMVNIEKQDVIFGFLPPFHSFGFTVTCILPLITGIKAVYYPNPIDGNNILKTLEFTKASLMATAPAFLKILLKESQNFDLSSLKYIFVGAEKCSENLKKEFNSLSPRTKILEGYGITECSPVISINPPEKIKEGSVGKFIEILEYLIWDEENNKILSNFQEGEILVRGESVFEGYLINPTNNTNPTNPTNNTNKTYNTYNIHKDDNSAFVFINDKKYYRSGDIGYIDEDEYLYISGRKKRFIKVAGEMISLPLIEEIIKTKFELSAEFPGVAISGLEADNSSKIILYTTQNNLNIEQINSYLQTQGLAPIIRIHEIKIVGRIPLLGSGKIDYKNL